MLAVLQYTAHDSLILSRSAVDHGEFWRVLTGNFVHTNTYHLLMNLSGLAVLALLFNGIFPLGLFHLSLLLISLVVGLGMYFRTDLTWYAGLSGTLYGLFIVGAVIAFIKKEYLLSLPLLFVIPIKLVWDNFHPNFTEPSAKLIGATVATDAHLYGILAGFIIGFFLFIFKSRDIA
ncbi:MAG: rhombosortase [Thiotrichaceae bacterium]|nr:rhombosortase [Thiotrichaceae bacterium]